MLINHCLQVLITNSLPNLLERHSQVIPVNLAIAVLIKYLENFYQLLRWLVLLHLAHHEAAELLEVDLAVAVDVHLADHSLDLRLRRVLPQRTHHSAKLRVGNSAAPVLVEETENFAELLDLLLGQVFCH